MKWYNNKFRRHLLDMHINDWSDDFLSEFSPDEYYRLLKKSNIQVAMIYLQSHIGLCYWPTKTGRIHKHFIDKPNDIKKLIDLCRSNGIYVVGYYSLNFNQWAHDNFPDWRMLEANGKSLRQNDESCRAGLCCPNSNEYREFVYKQIDEMLDFFDLDGMFFDMLYWQHECYCDSCKSRYLKETQKELPYKSECSLDDWLEFEDVRSCWMGEWAQAVSDYVHSKYPDMPVEHNLAAATATLSRGCRDSVAYASDYVGGDLYGGPMEQAFICSTYRDLSNNQPFEYMTGRCTPNLNAHTVTKTEDQLTRQVLHTCAHHGAFLAIDAIDPVGTMDERFYDLLGRIYNKEKVFEPYLTGDIISDVGIFYNFASAINLQGSGGDSAFLHFDTIKRSCNNRTASIQAAKHLISKHIPYEVTNKAKSTSFDRFRVIVAPMINRLEESVIDDLIKYVENGGNLYFSGCDEKRLFSTLIGGEICEYTETTKAYMFAADGHEGLLEDYNKKYPLPINMIVPLVEGIDSSNVLAYIELAYSPRSDGNCCASFHSDPPGVVTKYPALVEKQYGKGRVIWCAGAIEFNNTRDYGDILANIVKRLVNREFSVSSTAGSNVEIVSFRDDKKIRVSAVDITDSDELFVLPEFTVSIRTDEPAKTVKRLSDGKKVLFKNEDGVVVFTVINIRIMEMFEIEL